MKISLGAHQAAKVLEINSVFSHGGSPGCVGKLCVCVVTMLLVADRPSVCACVCACACVDALQESYTFLFIYIFETQFLTGL